MLFTILQVYTILGLIYTLIFILNGWDILEEYSCTITDITRWPLLGIEIFLLVIVVLTWAPALVITKILRRK